MYNKIDFHTHIYPEQIAAKATANLAKFYEFTVKGNGTISELEENGRSCGVQGFLLLGVATNAHQVERVNDHLLATTLESRSRGFLTNAFGCMHQDYENVENEVDRMLSIGLCGVKIHPDIQGVNIDDKRLMRLYEAIEGRMPIYFHMGDCREQYPFSKAKKLYSVMKRFPNLKVIAAHFGSYSEWENVPMLADMDNIAFDTSSSLQFMSVEKARELVELLGSDRIMFGSDYPVILPEEEIELFMKLGLSDEDNKKIFYDNAIRFLSACPNGYVGV